MKKAFTVIIILLLLTVSVHSQDIARMINNNYSDNDITKVLRGGKYNIWSWGMPIEDNPIYVAIEKNRVGLIKVLVQYGFDINSQDPGGTSLLMYSIKKKYSPSIIRELVNCGADVNSLDVAKNSPIILATWNSKAPYELYELLLMKGADRYHKNDYNESAIVEITKTTNDDRVIELFIEKDRIDDLYNGYTLLMIASKYNANATIVKKIVDLGASINIMSEPDGLTSYQIANKFNINKQDILKVFDSYGDNRKKDYNDRQYIVELIKSNNIERLKAVLDYGINVNETDTINYTPIMYAARYSSDPEIIKALILYGADVEMRDEKGFSSILLAAKYNKNSKILECLLSNNSSVNDKTYGKYADFPFGFQTPLIVASIAENNINIIEVLIKSGASINQTDVSLKTALMWAAMTNKKADIIRILLDNGADKKKKDEEGKTAFDYANKNSNIKNTKEYYELKY